tara:strand:+ start:991 stop:1197 length:207 start_codon:yes stop_codon:yes gene_type:complete
MKMKVKRIVKAYREILESKGVTTPDLEWYDQKTATYFDQESNGISALTVAQRDCERIYKVVLIKAGIV